MKKQNRNPMSKLRKMRETKACTQKELADKIGVHPMTISYYERGARTPDTQMLEKIAKALACDISDITEDKSIPFDDLYIAAKPLTELLRNNGCPHMTAIVTGNSVKIVVDDMAIPDIKNYETEV